MIAFKKLATERFFIPAFNINKGQAVQLIIKTNEHYNEEVIVKSLQSQHPEFCSVDLTKFRFKGFFSFKKRIRDLKDFDKLLNLERLSKCLIENSINEFYQIAELGYNLKYIIALELLLLNNNKVIISLTGLDYNGVSYLNKLVKLEIHSGKTFIILNEELVLSEYFEVGEQYQISHIRPDI